MTHLKPHLQMIPINDSCLPVLPSLRYEKKRSVWQWVQRLIQEICSSLIPSLFIWAILIFARSTIHFPFPLEVEKGSHSGWKTFSSIS